MARGLDINCTGAWRGAAGRIPQTVTYGASSVRSAVARAKKEPRAFPREAPKENPATTYSLAPQGNTIGVQGLTTVFGMGTGVALVLWSPEPSFMKATE